MIKTIPLLLISVLMSACDLGFDRNRNSSDFAPENLFARPVLSYRASTGEIQVRSSIVTDAAVQGLIAPESRFLLLGRGDSFFAQHNDAVYPMTLGVGSQYQTNLTRSSNAPVSVVLSRNSADISRDSITFANDFSISAGLDTEEFRVGEPVPFTVDINSVSGVLPAGFIPSIRAIYPSASCSIENSVDPPTLYENTNSTTLGLGENIEVENGMITGFIDNASVLLLGAGLASIGLENGTHQYCDLGLDILWSMSYNDSDDLLQIGATNLEGSMSVEYLANTINIRVTN